MDGVNRHCWRAKDRCIQCGEHIIHLGAKDFLFILAINPAALQAQKHVHVSTEDTDDAAEGGVVDGDDEELEADPDWALQGLKSALDNEDVDLTYAFDPGDVLGKALALIKQVTLVYQYIHTVLTHLQIRASPQAVVFLLKQCKNKGLDALELLNWIHTR